MIAILIAILLVKIAILVTTLLFFGALPLQPLPYLPYFLFYLYKKRKNIYLINNNSI